MNKKDRPDVTPERAQGDDDKEKDSSSGDSQHPADGDAIAEVGDAVGGPA